MHGGTLHFGWMWGFWIILLVAVVWGVLAVVRSRARSSTRSSDSPRQILERRYALGEIDKEEYERLSTDLRS